MTMDDVPGELDSLRAVIAELASVPSPEARIIHAPIEAPRRAAVFPGAFNPPTLAHLALAVTVRERGFDFVAFALATRTIDKENAGGLALEERLALLTAVATGERRLGVVLQNRGLYAEQALAIQTVWPAIDDLAFVVGMDKVAQIFDSRYYVDFERSLEILFRSARLLVAARGSLDRIVLDRLLETAPARPHRDRVEWVELDPRWRELSATAVREQLSDGELPDDWLPGPVARYLRDHPGRFSRSR
jgi:nicotinic acid mononucleotide adenylyltransferase